MTDPTRSNRHDAIWQVDLVQQVHKRLLDLVVRGELRPGDRLVEGELAQQMGVSRGPVREAARLLERGGFVRSEPRRGFFVCDIAANDIGDLYQMRCCIELFAAKAVVSRLTPDEKQKFRAIYNDLDTAAAAGTRPLDCMELTFSLHRLFCEIFGNPKMLDTFDSIVWQTRQIVTFVNQTDEKSSRFLAEQNRPVLEAVERGDPEFMETTILKYFDDNIADLEEYFSKSTDAQTSRGQL